MKQYGSMRILRTGIALSVMISYSLCGHTQAESSSQEIEQLKLLQQQMLQGAKSSPTKNTNNKNTEKTASKGTSTKSGSSKTKGGSDKSVPPELSKTEEEIVDERAFEATKKQLFPLTPEQIIELRQQSEEQNLAQNTSVGAPPRPTATSQFVNLSPGSTPPVIRLSQGFVSSVVFLDSTGAPWPITAYDLGDPSSFNIVWDKQGGNTLMIQALKLYTYGNLAVRLKKLNTPVMITLIPGQKAVDYRIDMRIQGIGPNAQTIPNEVGLPSSASDILLHVLDGVPPQGSERLTVSGGDARAWLYKNKMYVRTTLTILSPGWIGSMTSADGMHAYEMPKAPVLLVSWHGKVMQLKVEGL
jgi:intracellular multiplication protein IcmK